MRISCTFSKGLPVIDIATLGLKVIFLGGDEAAAEMTRIGSASDRAGTAIGAAGRALEVMTGKAAGSLGPLSSSRARVAMLGDSYRGLAAAIDKSKSSAGAADSQNASSIVSADALAAANKNVGKSLVDIATQIASGQSPFLVALQQGRELGALLGASGGGLKGAFDVLSNAIGSMLNPTTLLVSGLVGGAAALIQYFASAADSGKKANEQLQNEVRLIQSIAEKWGDALPQLKRYADERERIASDKDIVSASAAAAEAQWSSLRATAGDLRINFADLVSLLQAAGAEVEDISALQRSFNELAEGIEKGTATAENAKRVQRELADLALATGIPAVAAFAEQFSTLSSQIAEASDKASAFRQEAAVLTKLIPNLPPLGQLNPIISGDGRFITDANEQQNYRAEEFDRQNPRVLSSSVYVPVPLPEKRPNVEAERLPGEHSGRSAFARTGGVEKSNDYQSELRSIVERTNAIKSETAVQANLNPVLDDYGNAQTKAKAAADLLAAAEKQKLAITPALNAQINETAAAYANAVAEQNRQTEATKRAQEAMSFAKDLTKGFITDLKTGLQNGESFWKSFGNAAVNVLNKISDKLLNDVLDSLFKVNSAASGGGGIGGFFSSLLGFGGGGGFNIGSNATVPISGFDPFSVLPAGWADGGYTGSGGKHEPAGIVHAGEVVWSQKDIARAGGVGVVEAMRLGRRGYADGGVVGEGGPQFVRAQPDAAVPNRRLKAVNQNSASGANSDVHVTVGVSVDENGNLKAYVKNVAQSEAQTSTRQGLNDFNQQLPDRVAQINRNPRRR
ncbi:MULTISPECIES: phage tail length tape measure family protein [unclassified Rhizobium]|uniref:phage tail length tape measure family protein n=1 Tax=unclassified Rhizobium TaxID=2613769 RepID=UPI000CDF418E|nr:MULTISPECIES: phage tail length tape measure family protein [Rhizobium]AVA22183.1 phage-related minor tail protein [Rhizobium sp. NXC24]UWU19631.1 phage tail length tape measure family protein [Rhizobium tropici]